MSLSSITTQPRFRLGAGGAAELTDFQGRENLQGQVLPVRRSS